MADRSIATADGRVVAVRDVGDPQGRAVLVQLGTPNSRILYAQHVRDATERGIRLIGYDRPGYGGSTPRPGRSIVDCVTDVRTIMDALGIDRFATWGISGGGPHALACAALLPGRVAAAATLASTAPPDAPGLDFSEGAGRENREGVALMRTDPPAARARLERDRRELLASPGTLSPDLYSPPDAAALTPELAQHYRDRDRDGLAPGIEGWFQDSVALLSPWGFDPGSIGCPVMIWHGAHDRMVGVQHSRWLASHVPNAEPHFSAGDGHITLYANRVPEVHRWLLSQW